MIAKNALLLLFTIILLSGCKPPATTGRTSTDGTIRLTEERIGQPPVHAATLANAHTLTGKVIHIVDGDTLDILTAEKTTVRLRLHGVDCPERGQAFGTVAKQFTAEKCAGAVVVAEVAQAEKSQERPVVEVKLPNGDNLGRELVRAGLAWEEPRFSNDPTLKALEAEARTARRGLWADKAPVPPWEFRNAPKEKHKRN